MFTNCYREIKLKPLGLKFGPAFCRVNSKYLAILNAQDEWTTVVIFDLNEQVNTTGCSIPLCCFDVCSISFKCILKHDFTWLKATDQHRTVYHSHQWLDRVGFEMAKFMAKPLSSFDCFLFDGIDTCCICWPIKSHDIGPISIRYWSVAWEFNCDN